MYEYDGFRAKWRAIYDNKAESWSDLPQHGSGGCWENSDDPRYREVASLAYRIAANYAIMI